MNDGSAPAEPRSPREIESDIEHLRTRLDRSLAELDRRRHELTDVKLQMRKHPAAFIGAGAVLILMLGGVGYAVYRSRKRQELPAKAKRLRIAIGRAVDAPENVARGSRAENASAFRWPARSCATAPSLSWTNPQVRST